MRCDMPAGATKSPAPGERVWKDDGRAEATSGTTEDFQPTTIQTLPVASTANHGQCRYVPCPSCRAHEAVLQSVRLSVCLPHALSSTCPF